MEPVSLSIFVLSCFSLLSGYNHYQSSLKEKQLQEEIDQLKAKLPNSKPELTFIGPTLNSTPQ